MNKWLNVGAGRVDNPTLDLGEVEWTRLDGDADANPDIVHDFRQPFPDDMTGKYDGVIMSHCLEHVSWREALVVLDNVMQVVKPGGYLLLIVPSLEWACDQVLRGNFDFAVMGSFYGGQTTEWDYHRCGFTKDTLITACQRVGLTVNSVTTETYHVVMFGEQKIPAKEIRLVAVKP